jgi:hypothetical protein
MTDTVCGDAERHACHNGVDAVNMTDTVCGDAERHACHNGVDAVCMTGTAHGLTERQAHHNGVDTEILGSAGKPPVLVSCSTGATYAAGHVIVTCSLGCLKACSSTMFEPALPHHMVQVSERETGKRTEMAVHLYTAGVQSSCLCWFYVNMTVTDGKDHHFWDKMPV